MKSITSASTASGATIIIGKDAAQNDHLVSKYKHVPDTLWFHIKGHPGPHVILLNGSSQEDVQEAAHAALGKRTHGIVEYCAISNVHKPRGAPLGQVTLLEYSKQVCIARMK